MREEEFRVRRGVKYGREGERGRRSDRDRTALEKTGGFAGDDQFLVGGNNDHAGGRIESGEIGLGVEVESQIYQAGADRFAKQGLFSPIPLVKTRASQPPSSNQSAPTQWRME